VRAVLAGRREEEHVQAALGAVRSSGAVAAALAEAQAYARQAQEALLIFPPTPACATLTALADYAVARRR
jgi:geranylgeranyl pyrophosphate synthase